MRFVRTLSFAVLLSSAASSVAAQDQGFYAFGGLSFTSDVLGNTSSNTTSGPTFVSVNTGTTDQEGLGFQGGIGYRFTEQSALELLALRLPDTTQTWVNTSTALPAGTVSTSTNSTTAKSINLALTWVYGVPVSQQLNPFARAGVAVAYTESTTSNSSSGGSAGTGSSSGFNTGYILGLGNDFYFTPEKRTALRTELMLLTNTSSINTGSATLSTSFLVNF